MGTPRVSASGRTITTATRGPLLVAIALAATLATVSAHFAPGMFPVIVQAEVAGLEGAATTARCFLFLTTAQDRAFLRCDTIAEARPVATVRM